MTEEQPIFTYYDAIELDLLDRLNRFLKNISENYRQRWQEVSMSNRIYVTLLSREPYKFRIQTCGPLNVFADICDQFIGKNSTYLNVSYPHMHLVLLACYGADTKVTVSIDFELPSLPSSVVKVFDDRSQQEGSLVHVPDYKPMLLVDVWWKHVYREFHQLSCKRLEAETIPL